MLNYRSGLPVTSRQQKFGLNSDGYWAVWQEPLSAFGEARSQFDIIPYGDGLFRVRSVTNGHNIVPLHADNNEFIVQSTDVNNNAAWAIEPVSEMTLPVPDSGAVSMPFTLAPPTKQQLAQNGQVPSKQVIGSALLLYPAVKNKHSANPSIAISETPWFKLTRSQQWHVALTEHLPGIPETITTTTEVGLTTSSETLIKENTNMTITANGSLSLGPLSIGSKVSIQRNLQVSVTNSTTTLENVTTELEWATGVTDHSPGAIYGLLLQDMYEVTDVQGNVVESWVNTHSNHKATVVVRADAAPPEPQS